MRIYGEQEIQETIAACKKAAMSFDHRFYTTDKKLEGLLLKAATIITTYHGQNLEQQQTVALSDGKKLEAILEYLHNMTEDIAALNQAIANLQTAYEAQHAAIQEMLAVNAQQATPVDYSAQISKLNTIVQSIQSDDASITSVLKPVASTTDSSTSATVADTSTPVTDSSSSTTTTATETSSANTSSSTSTAS